jgi:hypothetical protein
VIRRLLEVRIRMVEDRVRYDDSLKGYVDGGKQQLACAQRNPEMYR